ncbi:MAG: heat-shock protein [Ghiorsea sp.]
MSSFLIILIAVSLLVAAALLWKNKEDFIDKPIDPEPEDIRVTPLLRGINYLLSDKPDQALQEMVQVAKIRSESAEVYMALGEMFRTQGEYGRAVRIHQNLLARPDVPQDFHFQAYVSLGRDFQAGGLLDRALRHYAKALAIQPDHLESLNSCLRIREQSHEWEEAEWLVSRLEQIEDESYHEHRAYLKAEMAEDGIEQKDYQTSKAQIKEALTLSSACTHAHLLNISLLVVEKKYDEAVQQAAFYLEEVKVEHHALLPKILLSDEHFYEQYAEPFLLDIWQQRHDVEMGVSWVEDIASEKGIEEARTLQSKLKLEGLSLRHELRLLALGEADHNLAQQAKYWRLSMKHYVCKHCGVQVHDVRWHCPKCNKWGTMEPLKASQSFGEDEDA